MASPKRKVAVAPQTRIDRVVSPSGIEAWLVEDYTVPLISMDFAFVGGGALDPAPLAGLSHLMAGLLDEGAGPYRGQDYQERLEDKAIEISFSSNRDRIEGSLRTLDRHGEAAFDMLALAVNQPRFDQDAIDRVKAQVMASLKREETDPDALAWKAFRARAFGDHPYGRGDKGTPASLSTITRADLVTAHGRRLARDRLKIAVVGAIDAETLGRALDRIFGGLPASMPADIVADIVPAGLGSVVVSPLAVPQSTLALGRPGLHRLDPDFMAAYVVNHILGGGSFTSRLWTEVRERRGLAYSVWSQLSTSRHSAMLLAGTATSNERVAESLAIIRAEFARMAEKGPSGRELDRALQYLIGSYALRFDTSRKIAGHLVEIQVEDLGIDYIAMRNSRMAAVTLADTRRVAARLIGDGGLLVAVAGQPEGIADT
ncbi:MAG TPA: pitrilysin family protein [Beijerinckiaceae bacterium]|nr:pitrilysin family protein [Beijerinckiaceae bacterium]